MCSELDFVCQGQLAARAQRPALADKAVSGTRCQSVQF